MNLTTSELEMRCKSLRRAGYSQTRIAAKLGVDRGRVFRALGDKRMSRSAAGKLGAKVIKAKGFDRVFGLKTPCGARA